jgi:SAM-dependent methyltransferase
MIAQARKLNPEVRYVQGDMRNVKLKRQFDAITVPDSLDYLTAANDIIKTVRNAYDHLKPGGVFLIVIENTAETFRQNANVIYNRSRGKVRLTVIENAFDPDPRDTSYEVTFIHLISRKGKLTIETDRHLLGLFPIGTWKKLIRETGFKVKAQKYTARPPETGTFPMFICPKPEKA